MSSFDWTTIGTIASTRVFNLGKTSQRLDSIEADLTEFKQDVNRQFFGVRQEINTMSKRLDERMDKLILTIAKSK
jgi:hypothetical protein